MTKRAVIAMSGGVDSSVAASLLVEQGYEVIGLFMRLGIATPTIEESGKRGCCSVQDAHDARCVADSLGIHFYVLNFKEEFDEIIDYFCHEYASGRTPNPCILCNQKLKFGRLLRFAQALNADYIATGHYARVEKSPPEAGRYLLKKGIDQRKDQSYVLFSLTQEQLSRALFPLGTMTKDEVRQKARNLNLKTKDKQESQEICFVPENDYRKLILERRAHGRGDRPVAPATGQVEPGIIKDTKGHVLGKHPGIEFFTIGQRRGIGIAFGKPKYVVNINPTENTITIGSGTELLESELTASELNWISISTLENPMEVQAKIRYNHKPSKAMIYPIEEGRVRVIFNEPQMAITPGQAVVFYDGDIIVGGGWIDSPSSR
ncbi:MAG TPA: tRNA 2-thiouridine(34) synthase MnmA [Candidatus Brocadiia bacterium]|nr:tRNA 2-thiouridine(34) synthase MnmA [Candidatus Brocadiales bacterium]